MFLYKPLNLTLSEGAYCQFLTSTIKDNAGVKNDDVGKGPMLQKKIEIIISQIEVKIEARIFKFLQILKMLLLSIYIRNYEILVACVNKT